MNAPSFIFRFAFRLLRREWARYVLSASSLFVTSLTFTVVLVGVAGAREYLSDRSREFAGGDIAFESNVPVDPGPIVAPLAPYIQAEGREIDLLLSIRNDRGSVGVSARAVSESFPLYGAVRLESGAYRPLAPDEVYIERKALEKLDASDEIFIGTVSYRVAGVVLAEPDSLVQGFRLAPRLLLSLEGLERSGVKLAESRSEYEYRYRLDPATPQTIVTTWAQSVRDTREGLRVRVAGSGDSGFLRRLSNVERFFLITILIGAILSAVNVFANAVSLVQRLKKSFAVLLVEGATPRQVVAVVLLIIAVVTLSSALLGLTAGVGLVQWLYAWIERAAEVPLVFSLAWPTVFLILAVTIATSLGAALPALRELLTLKPRMLLSGERVESSSAHATLFLFLAACVSFLPLFFLAAALLDSAFRATIVVGGTLIVYVTVAALVGLGLTNVYRIRHRFGFFFRTVIAEKYSDGLFGIVTAASLFVALLSIFSLALLERSLERFFDDGLSGTLPSAYIIDIQTDQVSLVTSLAPEARLFPNVRGRILRIDDRDIEQRLEQPNTSETGELRREFNLTYRTDLLETERVIAGSWQGSRTGEVSVDESFADEADIRIGSEIEFLIQGVPLTARVTSLRSTDRTTGLPFFYFVFSPAALERFTATSFGYADITGASLRLLEQSLAAAAPNITVLDTSAIGETVRSVTETVLLLLAVATLPPLALAVLLLVTLVATSFAGRRRDAVRFQVLGATEKRTTALYLTETAVTIVVVGFLAALASAAIVVGLTSFVLDGVTPVLVDWWIIEILAILLVVILIYAVTLMYLRRQPLRQALSSEEYV